jgi:DNA-binding XRE family transcriptional regulator
MHRSNQASGSKGGETAENSVHGSDQVLGLVTHPDTEPVERGIGRKPGPYRRKRLTSLVKGNIMDRHELLKLRDSLDATQTEMAAAMGVPLRTYQDIETGISKFRPIHERAAAWAVISLALANDKTEVIPAPIADMLKSAAAKLG